MTEPTPEASSSGSSSSVFKILLATDCHLGYEERSSKKTDRQDSFITFEEILQIAVAKRVDFILLGGDLFHDSTPSQNVVLRCINLLRKYCFGDRKIKFQFLSDPSEVLSNITQELNFENENLNIGLPIFTIHGNHDNPSFEYTSTLDILAASGVINYFGKVSDLTQITISPMILKKGDSYIAIYGLSYIGDQRLSRLLKNDMVKFLRPENIENCFNILVLHQNRAAHTRHGSIPEDKLPSFFDLIFWGHEHECRIVPELISLPDNEKYYITQPGSSVATSMAIGESKLKHVGVLKIQDGRFLIDAIKLQTVRPLVFDTIDLTEIINKGYCDDSTTGVLEYVDDYIANTMLPQVEQLITENPNQPKIPFLRLKVVYKEEIHMFDSMLITRKYADRVANAKDLILFRRDKRGLKLDSLDFDDNEAAADLAECFQHETDKDWSLAIQKEVENSLKRNNAELNILSLLGMNEALDRCIKANDNNSFFSIFNYQVKKTLDHFETRDIKLNRAEYEEELRIFREERAKNSTDEINQVKGMLDNKEERQRLNGSIAVPSDLMDVPDLENADDPMPVPTRGRGRARASRARAGTRGAARGGRGRAAAPAASPARSPLTISTQARNNQTSNNGNDRFFQPTQPSQLMTSTQRPSARKPTQFYNSDSD